MDELEIPVVDEGFVPSFTPVVTPGYYTCPCGAFWTYQIVYAWVHWFWHKRSHTEL